jgi:zinc transport system substrate-binding protein
MRGFISIGAAALSLLWISAFPAPALSAAPSVFVSVEPQRFFVERIGGPELQVEVLVGPGQSPATLDPSAKIIAKLSSADIYFRTGLPFEEVLLKRFNGGQMGLKVVDVREGMELMPLKEHGHGGDTDHDTDHEGELDPHVWLSPRLAAQQARVIAAALAGADPEAAAQYRKNLELLLADLERVDGEIAQLLEPYRGREFLVFHPSFGYFARAYGLKQVAVQHEGKEPGARSMARIVERAKKAGVSAVVAQPQFADRAARAIADALGGQVLKADPLASDYLENLERVAATLMKAMKTSR